jgi:hypothetical protein
MGYNVEISINILKETKFSEVENTIQHVAEFYNCDNIYSLSEEDGTKKIPIYNCIYVINFVDENFDNLIKFLKFIKRNKSSYIECIYENDVYKLLYASSFYLKSIDKELSKKYKQFIKDKNFTPNETKLLRELI